MERQVAVVIVSYRCAALTIESIRSLRSERATPGLRVRVIVVDNASGDLPAIQEAVDRNAWTDWVSLIAAPRNGGFAYGNNLGIARAFAEGAPDYVYLLNPDAEVRPAAIEVLVNFLESHPEVGIAGGSFEDPDGTDWPMAFRFPSLLSELDHGLQAGWITRLLGPWVVAREMPKVNAPTDWICGAAMLIRRQVFASIGGLDENYFLYFEETDFCFRAREAGFSTWYVPASRVMHARGQSTKVTDPNSPPKRLPAYWFESRRRYFAVTYGTPMAIAIDLVALVSHSLGTIKRVLLGRSSQSVPHFMRDLLHHSVLWPRNRAVPRVRAFKPAPLAASAHPT